MPNIPTHLHALLAALSVFSLLSLVFLLVVAILITLVFSIVAVRLIPSTRHVAEVAHENATLQREFDACKMALNVLVDGSDRHHVSDAKTTPAVDEPSTQLLASSPTPALGSETESERVQALEARLDFLRDSCQIMVAQKTDMLAQKDALLARQNVDLATLTAQLAATHQTKDELLAEKDASCRTILAQKTDELAALKAQLAAIHQTIATVTTERDEAVARADTAASELEKTRADYDDKIASFATRAADAECRAAALRTAVQQQEADIGDVLLKNNNLRVENAILTKRLESASRQRPTPSSSPRYSFQSFMSPRSSESESDSSFDSDRPSPSRWRRFTIRRVRKSGKL